MDRKTLDKMVPVTELAQRTSAIVQEVEDGDFKYIVKRNKVVAVVMNIEILLAIKELSKTWSSDQDDNEWADIVDYATTVVAVRKAKNQPELPFDLDELLSQEGSSREDLG
jgi:antitoxin (DNA-binding transcriptional repressor) of toxin-antitoxin stability system